MLRIIKDGLKKDPTRWTRMAKQIVGVSEETTTGVKRLYEMQEVGGVFVCVRVLISPLIAEACIYLHT